jgi:hypothetical protein
MFPYHQPTDEFHDLLQAHQPAALAIVAHACIVFHDPGMNWAMKGCGSLGFWDLPKLSSGTLAFDPVAHRTIWVDPVLIDFCRYWSTTSF